MSDYCDVAGNFHEDELRKMIDAGNAVNGATHPLVATAAFAISLELCPTTTCTNAC